MPIVYVYYYSCNKNDFTPVALWIIRTTGVFSFCKLIAHVDILVKMTFVILLTIYLFLKKNIDLFYSHLHGNKAMKDISTYQLDKQFIDDQLISALPLVYCNALWSPEENGWHFQSHLTRRIVLFLYLIFNFKICKVWSWWFQLVIRQYWFR